MKKFFVFIMALALMFSLVFTSVPLDAFATTNDTTEGETSGQETTPDDNSTVKSLSYAKVKNSTTLYKSDKTTPVIELEPSSIVFNVQPIQNDPTYHVIKWQNENLYVKTADLEEATGAQINEKSRIVSLIVPKDTPIYTSTTGAGVLGTIKLEQTVSIVGDANGYFQVQIGGVTGYIKKQASYSAKIASGSLLSSAGAVVGTINSGNTYFNVVPTANIYRYQITIGSNAYLVDSSLLTLKTSTNAATASSRKEIITIKAASKIYADSALKQPIVTLASATKTNILSISGNNYLVQVGNTVGYVPISSTTGTFVVRLNANAKIFKNTAKTSTLAINKNNGIVYTVARTSDNSLFSIVIGSKTYYVNYADIVFTTENPKTANSTRKDTIKLKSGFVLYKDANTKTPLFTNGLANEQFISGGAYGQYYKVYVGSNVVYVPASYVIAGANREVSKSGSTVLYKYVNKKYVAVGTVLNGFTFKPTSSNKTYYIFKKGNETFAVKKADTVATNQTVSLKSKASASFPVTLYTERHSAIYNANGVKIATLYKGQTVALKGISKRNYAIIDYMGQQAEVKFTDLYHKNIVNGKSNISYNKMAYYLKVVSLMYPEFTKLEQIGKSVEGRPLYALRVGNGKKEILMDASLHAREHMTTNVLLEMIDSYSNAYVGNKKFAGYNVRGTLNTTSIWFLPMMNPDGVMLVQQGIGSLKNKSNINFVKKHARKGSYKHWKANARGVDLNRNFDGVNWKGISSPKSPTYAQFKGYSPNSEPETKAFINFANKHQFKSYLSYHSSGNLIYWDGLAREKYLTRTYNLLMSVSKVNGYKPEKFPFTMFTSNVPSKPKGHSTAWMMKNKKIPVLTIEIAPYQGEKPVALSKWSSVWNKNKSVGLLGAAEASKY